MTVLKCSLVEMHEQIVSLGKIAVELNVDTGAKTKTCNTGSLPIVEVDMSLAILQHFVHRLQLFLSCPKLTYPVSLIVPHHCIS